MGGISASVRAEMIRDEINAAGPEVVSLFNKIKRQGATDEWAAMCALRQAPGSRNTDRAFCQGAARQTAMMADINRKAIYEMAKKAGISTQGKWYKGSLGRPTDPCAWVSSADDVIAVAKKKNLFIDGVINHKGVRIEQPPPDVDLAPDLVREGVNRLLVADPALAEKVKKNPKSLREVEERVIAKHGKKRTKKPL